MEDQQKSKIVLVVQSALLYVLAFMLTTIWHEFGHAIVGVLAGGHPTMYHNSVVGDESVVMSLAASLAVKMAGPLFSLFQAGVFSWLFVRSTRRTLVPLFVLWMAVLGYNNFFGYLFTSSFAKAGDLGQVVALLEFPWYGIALVSLIGISGQLFVIALLTKPFLSFMPAGIDVSDRAERLRFMKTVLIFPWLIGSVVYSLLALPSPALISLVYPFMSGMPFIMPWKAAGNPRFSAVRGIGRIPGRVPYLLWVILIGLVLFHEFILISGIKF